MATPQVIKRLLRSSSVQWALSCLAGSYMTFVRWTARVDRPPPPTGGPFLIAMWHGRLMLLDYLRPGGRSVVTLISGNRDGQLISKIALVGSWGAIRSVTGSSSRGGTKAIRELLRFAHAGTNLFITPDGPRGPNMRAQRGVVELARLTGLPILPASASASWGNQGRSWDRFMVPFPFTRIAVRWGELVRVGRDTDIEAMVAQVETALTAIQQAADDACGRVSPALSEPARHADGAAAKTKTARST
jgi:lysophospholipid acyltransferase (LPLAT)-like uncharacterized protein